MDLLFILIGIGLAIFVILVSYKSISRGVQARSEAKKKQTKQRRRNTWKAEKQESKFGRP